eukprot:Lithocolla_globosa_v1_NODE_881_length_3142_cov_19.214772.p2 type:complete len:113 gc:universal NODE_881_length_3142_cov_19.214772:1206-1544(+)
MDDNQKACKLHIKSPKISQSQGFKKGCNPLHSLLATTFACHALVTPDNGLANALGLGVRVVLPELVSVYFAMCCALQDSALFSRHCSVFFKVYSKKKMGCNSLLATTLPGLA